MKNVTLSVSDQAWRQARIGTAERGTSFSRVAQYLIAILPVFPRPVCRFPMPQTAVNYTKPISPVKTSHQRPTFVAQTSAQIPTLSKIFSRKNLQKSCETVKPGPRSGCGWLHNLPPAFRKAQKNERPLQRRSLSSNSFF
jgi:hypothetical protein